MCNVTGMGDFLISTEPKPQADDCKETCSNCIRAQRLASISIAASIDEVVALLEHHNLKAAESYAVRLLGVLDEVPLSTAELLGPPVLAQLRVRLNHGLLEIRTAAQLQALGTFRSALRAWFDSYPPHRV